MSTRKRSGPLRTLAAAVTVTAVMTSGTAAYAQPGPEEDSPPPARPKAGATSIAPDKRAEMIGPGWATSTDVAWTMTGDAGGLHLLVAAASSGYGWHTLATLSEPGLEADQWIGNACVTGSGRQLAVVYAPRTFTNKAHLFDRGGFTAVVDLVDGEVRKLPVQSSLAYFNPGCGAGEEVVLTQGGDEDLGRTRLVRVDAAAATVISRVEVPGQLTSPVPTARGIVAADRGALVTVDAKGARRVLTPSAGVPFKLAADASGGVVFMEATGTDRVAVRRAVPPAAGKTRAPSVTTLADGALRALDVTSGRGGHVFVTGAEPATRRAAPPSSVSLLDVAKGARLSTHGGLAVTSVLKAQPDPRVPLDDPAAPQRVTIAATLPATGQAATFSVTPDGGAFGGQGPAAGRLFSPSLGTPPPGMGKFAGDPNSPADLADRYCSVPRNDPANQAMQPKPRQVEWAVDQAIRDSLRVQRPANWKNLGMPAYTPQGLFPFRAPRGGGYVPAQVLLGIAAQESNMWQAARFAVPGVTGNPLIGNYFGLDVYNDTEADDWTINWAEADCGYGVMQITDGMRLAGREKPNETARPYNVQRAIALDFAVNVAAGLDILVQKWNDTNAAGMIINNGNPAKIENWFYAVWAYNSGFYANKGDGSPWGVGWANNPVNPRYPANRDPFLEYTYGDAAHPQHWPYPEKVMGWAGHPVEVLEAPNTLVAGYRAAWWNGGGTIGQINRATVSPPPAQFCDDSNQCEPGAQFPPNAPDVIGEPAGPCAHKDSAGRYDLRCWYNQPSTWKADCDYSCGNELLRFDPGYAYQDDGTAYPPRCTLDGLPSNAQIVDDVPDGTPSVRPNCGRPWTNAGTFQFTFAPDGAGQYPAKVDTHQIGGGFGGHFWFTHTRTADDKGGRLKVSATWKLNASRNGPMRVLVALPDHGAHTKLARYVVKTANGDRVRVIKQPGSGNRWVSLGAFMFNGVPQVTLTSVTPDGDGSQDVAFDAMAFVPITGTYQEHSVESIGHFDEDENLDVAAPSSWLSGPLAGRQALYDWATSNTSDILALPNCPPEFVGECLLPGVRTFAQTWRDEVLAAGTDPVNHPDGKSIATWIGFGNSYLARPANDQRPASFDHDQNFKIRMKATVSFVTGPDGKVIPGSEWAEYEHRSGHTLLPRFMKHLFQTLDEVYNIAPPDLTYRVRDLNAHNGAWTAVNGLDGALPSRALANAGKAPVLVDAAGTPSETNATCVAALAVSGAVDGYRPMLSVAGPANGAEDWVQRIKDRDMVPSSVIQLAEDIQDTFFNDGLIPGLTTSIFTQAPPIWQEFNFRVCADGTIRKNSDRPLLRVAWMTDFYLYHNGRAMNLDGAFSGSNQPVILGDFTKLSAAPDPNQSYPLWPNPFGPCDAATDRSGNPWDFTAARIPPEPAGHNPDHGHFCVDRNLPIDPSHSS